MVTIFSYFTTHLLIIPFSYFRRMVTVFSSPPLLHHIRAVAWTPLSRGNTEQLKVLSLLQGCAWRDGWKPHPLCPSFTRSVVVPKSKGFFVSKLPLCVLVRYAFRIHALWLGGGSCGCSRL